MKGISEICLCSSYTLNGLRAASTGWLVTGKTSGVGTDVAMNATGRRAILTVYYMKQVAQQVVCKAKKSVPCWNLVISKAVILQQVVTEAI